MFHSSGGEGNRRGKRTITWVTAVQKTQCHRVKKNGYGKCHVDRSSLLKRIIAIPKIIQVATARKGRRGTPNTVKGAHEAGVADSPLEAAPSCPIARPPPSATSDELDIYVDDGTQRLADEGPLEPLCDNNYVPTDVLAPLVTHGGKRDGAFEAQWLSRLSSLGRGGAILARFFGELGSREVGFGGEGGEGRLRKLTVTA